MLRLVSTEQATPTLKPSNSPTHWPAGCTSIPYIPMFSVPCFKVKNHGTPIVTHHTTTCMQPWKQWQIILLPQILTSTNKQDRLPQPPTPKRPRNSQHRQRRAVQLYHDASSTTQRNRGTDSPAIRVQDCMPVEKWTHRTKHVSGNFSASGCLTFTWTGLALSCSCLVGRWLRSSLHAGGKWSHGTGHVSSRWRECWCFRVHNFAQNNSSRHTHATPPPKDDAVHP